MKPLVPFVCRLPGRRLLRVRGTEAHEYLQGVFTNDLRTLQPSGSMYGCFLYFTGRVLCDAHLYQCRLTYEGQASILIDVHERSAEDLFEHLCELKMRKKVKIENVGQELAVVAALEALPANATGTTSPAGEAEAPQGASAEPALLPPTLQERHTECFTDARGEALFFSPPPSTSPSPPQPTWQLRRCVASATWAPPPTSADPYTSLLYGSGIGEGPEVFRNNKSLPFEGNLDFLKGVSFHKGCYVGQELTHRTHVMLVTRKRTVPLRFGSPQADGSAAAPRAVEAGEPLFTAAKEKIGEVTGVCGDVGIGLLRLRYVDKATQTVPGLQLRDGTPVHTRLPDWWPKKEVKKLLKNNE